MRIRESGMPEEEQWTQFFDPIKILATLDLNQNTIDAVDFGCGYGTFTIPAAKIVRGTVYAFDIEAEMIRILSNKIKTQNLKNIRVFLRDFVSEGSGLEDNSVDYVMLFNILHLENPINLLRETHRILTVGGKTGVIHWKQDETTPAGPPMNIRPKPQQIIQWAKLASFRLEKQFDIKPYHYGIVFRKKF